MREIDYDDTGRTLARHQSGDMYVVELASVWEGDRCVGTQIVASDGPLHHSDLGIEGWADLGRFPTRVFECIRDMLLLDSDAEWLNEQESCGALSYPLGYVAATIHRLNQVQEA